MPRKQLKDFSDSMEVKAAHMSPTARSDFAWFVKNPDCRYHLREPFTDEYKTHETPTSHRWCMLVHLIIDQNPIMYTSDDGGKTVSSAHMIQLGHIPVPCDPVDSDFLAQLVANQTTDKSQTILKVLWADGLEKMGIVNSGGVKK
ncbi:hypothetical protein XBP1_2230009 [Xenorhabdus bovienii str. puntauvense]|uniref:Uncharacterized protein n=1 Tax=Xenorhabdus bovienii str. puntauvense TaxID=1398201 RepID=A0A077NED2_XENBV|nr:hypothetical protein [Xenorhabdus bovienii]CDG96763.1 hypothetical protein XBP1_2230009 [Xenorhabdus bovienii str. puntauvense]